MPENETLIHDGKSANRWRSLRERMENGLELTGAFPEIRDQFCRSLKQVWRQWKEHGVDPADLFAAALNNPRRLDELIRQTHSDHNARLFREVASSLGHRDMNGLIDGFLAAAWESACIQLQLDRLEDTLSPEFMKQSQGMLERIQRSLLKNPSHFPANKSKIPPPNMDARLGESLL